MKKLYLKSLKIIAVLLSVIFVFSGYQGAFLTPEASAIGVGVITKFSVDGQSFFTDLIGSNAVNPGQIITVRLEYDNATNSAFQNTSVKAQIPSGFELVSGGTRNCMTPSVGETVCGYGSINESSVWSGGNLTISPTAGLYDISNGQTSGVFEMGKKRYLNFSNCDYINNNDGNTDETYNFSPSNSIQILSCGAAVSGTSFRSQKSLFQPADLMGKRYGNVQNCDYFNGTDSDDVVTMGIYSLNGEFQNTPSTSLACLAIPQTPNLSQYSLRFSNSEFFPTDHLGKRYLNFSDCDAINLSNNNTDDEISFSPGNTPISSYVCNSPAINTVLRSSNSSFNPIDLLDTARGKGFIEFKVKASLVGGTYTESSSVQGNGFQTVSDSGQIEVRTQQVQPACSDNIDNDGDGATDYSSDFSCSSSSDNDEANPKAQCQDGIDNDGDGAIDYPNDPGCANKQDNTEQNAAAVCSSNSSCGTDSYVGSSYCMGNSVYRNYTSYACNNPGLGSSYCSSSASPQLQQNCSSNQFCSFGSCVNVNSNSCTSRSYQQCSGNSVYWHDSCGNRQDVVQVCSAGQNCSGNACVNVNYNYCSDHSYKQCVNSNAIHWFNSCDAQQDLYQVCSTGQICSSGACIVSQQQTGFAITKTVKNLSAGLLNWSNSVSASPSDIVQFTVSVNNYSNQTANNVVVRDSLPANLLFNGNLTIDGISNSGNIAQGITIGNMSSNQIKIISYQAQVAQGQNFSFGTTTLNNSVIATGANFNSVTATASVIVLKSGVLGATTISTGLTNNILLDSFIIPLLIALFGIWLFRSGLVGMPAWLVSRRKKIKNISSQRRLENKVSEIRQNENIK